LRQRARLGGGDDTTRATPLVLLMAPQSGLDSEKDTNRYPGKSGFGDASWPFFLLLPTPRIKGAKVRTPWCIKCVSARRRPLGRSWRTYHALLEIISADDIFPLSCLPYDSSSPRVSSPVSSLAGRIDHGFCLAYAPTAAKPVKLQVKIRLTQQSTVVPIENGAIAAVDRIFAGETPNS
jgi:hypothetical protein